MRDGVTLYADVYRPTGNGRHPVILSITPYSTERFPTAYDAAVYFAQRGYAYVFQDVRGRHESEGVWIPFVNDEKDAYDTVEWAAKQPWSDGKVAMQGGSYLGQNQWRAAQAESVQPGHHLPDGGLHQHLSRLDHAQRRLAPVVQLRLGTGPAGIADHAEPRAAHDRRTARHSLRPGAAASAAQHDAAAGGAERAFLRRVAGQPRLQRYWKPFNVEERFDKIAVPVHTFGGWFDIFSQGTLRGYVGMSQKGATERARRMSHLVIGPWGHGPSQKFGALDFGPTANVDALTLQLRWYDYWLKGIDNGLGERSASQAVRHGPQRVGLRTRVSARPHRLPAAVFQQRRQGEYRRRRRPTDVDEARRRVTHGSVPLRSRRPRPVRGRQQLLRHADGGGAAGPAAHRGASRRPRLHDRRPARKSSRPPARSRWCCMPRRMPSTRISLPSWSTCIPTARATTWRRAFCAPATARA